MGITISSTVPQGYKCYTTSILTNELTGLRVDSVEGTRRRRAVRRKEAVAHMDSGLDLYVDSFLQAWHHTRSLRS